MNLLTLQSVIPNKKYEKHDENNLQIENYYSKI